MPRLYPAGVGEGLRLPYFLFCDLPSGVVTFGFYFLSRDELLRHDTRIPTAYYQTNYSLSELMIGK